VNSAAFFCHGGDNRVLNDFCVSVHAATPTMHGKPLTEIRLVKGLMCYDITVSFNGIGPGFQATNFVSHLIWTLC